MDTRTHQRPSPGAGSRAAGRSLILYELNEVPWRVVDLYVSQRPGSHLAALLRRGLSLTTVDADPVPLQPWRTWPTLHTSLHTAEHNSFDLGQDPATFRGTPMWDVVEGAGLPVGLFGPLQSWPPRPFDHGGFFVPDTFSRSPETFPAALSRFQAFNISMTRENTFSSEAAVGAARAAGVGADLIRHGLTPASAGSLAVQLVRERLDGRYRARRAIYQAMPGFDLYWRLHRRIRPALSVFFTNHVAGMMHRYWGDWVAEYARTEDYVPDPVYRGFVPAAMDATDRHLGRLRRHLDAYPGTVLVVAASMGQGPIPYHHLADTFVLDDPDRLLVALGLGPAAQGLAMYPRIALDFADEGTARGAVAPLASVGGPKCGPLLRDFNVNGRTVTFEVNFDDIGAGAAEVLTATTTAGAPLQARPAELGVALRPRTGGGNTAYHVPEGMLLAYGDGIGAGGGRAEVDILDVAPSLLANVMGLAPAPGMRGEPRLFR